MHCEVTLSKMLVCQTRPMGVGYTGLVVFFAFKSKCAKIEFGIRYLWKMEISRNKKKHLFKKKKKKKRRH